MPTPTPNKCDNPSCPLPEGSPPTPLLLCSRCRATRYCSQTCQAACWASHKRQCRRLNYIIKFRLAPAHITDPRVERTLSCPANAPFYALHLALQTAFGWATTHSFDFAVKDPAYVPPPPGDLLAHVQQIMAVDGRGERPASAPREYLLRVVDPVQGDRFSGIDRAHEPQRRHPHTVEKKSDDWCLWQLLEKREYQGKELVYTYDFGDNWEHYFTVEGRGEFTDHFVCLSGTGHPVGEDVGGNKGWNDLKAAYLAERPTEDQRDSRKWYETRTRNGDPKGLAGDRVNVWDMAQVNRDLVDMLDRFERMADQAASERDMLRDRLGV
ncbi:MM3350-like domain-containing protein [Chaetomium fimeti]|uniref:MM3350-like domain-containing protein n=1 Tax=Chaetomium fimeti TaxID=1854472 RepID=A0AAE0H7L9_9PEZI|nr:MM3350-like domain-containing protein [Chaetomium fimeti]